MYQSERSAPYVHGFPVVHLKSVHPQGTSKNQMPNRFDVSNQGERRHWPNKAAERNCASRSTATRRRLPHKLEAVSSPKDRLAVVVNLPALAVELPEASFGFLSLRCCVQRVLTQQGNEHGAHWLAFLAGRSKDMQVPPEQDIFVLRTVTCHLALFGHYSRGSALVGMHGVNLQGA